MTAAQRLQPPEPVQRANRTAEKFHAHQDCPRFDPALSLAEFLRLFWDSRELNVLLSHLNTEQEQANPALLAAAAHLRVPDGAPRSSGAARPQSWWCRVPG